MRIFYFILLSIIIFKANAQTYKVTKVEYINDPDVAKYFEGKGMIQWKGMMRNEFEQRTKSQMLKLEVKDDALLVTPVNAKSNRSREIPKVEDGIYQLTNSRMFMRFNITSEDTLMVQGRYKSLGAPEGSPSEIYEKLKERYGEKVETYVTKSYLTKVHQSELDNAINVEKAYKVTDVKFKVNEDVMAFGKAHRQFFMGKSKKYEDQVKETYMGRQFKVKIDFNKINISSYEMENSSFSYSSSLEKTAENVYRATVMKSYWDFYTNASSEEEFDVQKLEYIEFLELTEEDKELPEYEKLKTKYGDKLPYNNIVQEVEELQMD